jgi:hypothetical protein
MHARIACEPMLPAVPFASWLHGLHAEPGAWHRVGEQVGLGAARAHRYGTARGSVGKPLIEISARVAQRCAEHAGTTLDAIYPDATEAAA